ncbi:MAG TPA: FG-GAP-like repeat-containing protein [Terriglobales bacterium]|nr:FG-GAP-like repeat-containing protein [Terriglobales bacterium]
MKAGLDNFVSEQYADQIAAILAQWSSGLLQSPPQLQAIEKVLGETFEGSSSRSSDRKQIRSGPPVEIHQLTFNNTTRLRRNDFLNELRSSLASFSKILTAEFQVISIQAEDAEGGPSSVSRSTGGLQTRVRYELVGTGPDFYREQRVGHWDLEWQPASSTQGNEFRVRKWQFLQETRSHSGSPVFADISSQAFGEISSYAAQLLHGSDYFRTILDGACGIDIYGHNGISVGDIDNDGFDDLYVCQPAGLPNRLYRNRGDGTFEDITEKSGVGILENTACALFADINNDGRQDLIVVRTNGPLLFLNEGGGKFRPKPDAFKFAGAPQGTFTGAALADYDRDGWLDIYFCLYIYYQGTDQYKYPTPYYDAENGPPNFMMRNNRDGTFMDVTAQTHLDQNNTRYSFCCAWTDYNRDGWPDLYAVNDFGRKNLYRNNGDGTFTDVAAMAGAEDVGAGMSVCWFDYDNDGAQDLYVADMWTAAGKRVSSQPIFQKDAPENVRTLYRKHAMGNSLFRNGGKGNFQDVSAEAGVEMGRWSWSSDAWDFDHDGFPDLYITNGMISGLSQEDLNSFFWRQVVARSPVEAKPSYDYEQGWNAVNELIRSDGTWSGFERNVFYANNRDGTFSDVSGAVGLDFVEDGRAFALADFDQDGRLEIFLKNRNAPQLRLLKNVVKNLPPSVAFRLRGTKSNRDAIGAEISVDTESGRQTRVLQAGSGFLSQHSKEIIFGLGEAKGPVRASIRWPSGLVQEIKDLPINHRIWVEEGTAPSRMEAFKSREPVRNAAVEAPRHEVLPTTAETWLLAPIAAPEFSLPDLAGQSRTLASLQGKPALLNFWTIQSPQCEQVLKLMQLQYGRWFRLGLQLLTINVDESAESERIRTWVRQRGYSFPVLQGTDDTAGVYNILYRYLFDRHRDLTLPTSFLVDEKGNVVKLYQGQLNAEHVEQDFQHIPQTFSERLAKALPFTGTTEITEFRRNYLSYGSVYFQRGYYEHAGKAFQTALSDDPTSAEALYGLGSVYLQQQKNKEARECFERATRLQATYPGTLANAWNNLGLLTAREGHSVEAVGYFQQALRLNPDHPIALVNLGNAYRQQKLWEQARAPLQRAVELSPDDPEANYALAMVLAQMNEEEQAYEYLQRALKLRPIYPEALNNLGILLLRSGRRNEAVAKFEECIRVAPAFDQAYLNLARVYALEDKPEQARDVLLVLLKQHPGHTQAEEMMRQLKK